MSRYNKTVSGEPMSRGAAGVARSRVQAENRDKAREVTAENDRLYNRNLTRAGGSIPKATNDEVVAVSKRLNARIDELVEQGESHTAMKLFNLADNDHSGQIGWEEFGWMARNELRLR